MAKLSGLRLRTSKRWILGSKNQAAPGVSGAQGDRISLGFGVSFPSEEKTLVEVAEKAGMDYVFPLTFLKIRLN